MENQENISQEDLRLFRIAISKAFTPFAPALKSVALDAARIDRIAETGWLPHYTTPYAALPTLGNPVIDCQILDAHYAENWNSVATQFTDRLDSYAIDDQTKAVFIDCLSAHAAGLFRCVPCTVFSELERVIRKALETPIGKNLPNLRDATGRLLPKEGSVQGVASFELYKKLVGHIYIQVKTPEALARFDSDPVPNRHAAIHGLISYSSQQCSFNALVLAEFGLSCVPVWQNTTQAYNS